MDRGQSRRRRRDDVDSCAKNNANACSPSRLVAPLRELGSIQRHVRLRGGGVEVVRRPVRVVRRRARVFPLLRRGRFRAARGLVRERPARGVREFLLEHVERRADVAERRLVAALVRVMRLRRDVKRAFDDVELLLQGVRRRERVGGDVERREERGDRASARRAAPRRALLLLWRHDDDDGGRGRRREDDDDDDDDDDAVVEGSARGVHWQLGRRGCKFRRSDKLKVSSSPPFGARGFTPNGVDECFDTSNSSDV